MKSIVAKLVRYSANCFDLYGWFFQSACHSIANPMLCHPFFQFSVNHCCRNNSKCSASCSWPRHAIMFLARGDNQVVCFLHTVAWDTQSQLMPQSIACHVWWLAAYIILQFLYLRLTLDMGLFHWVQILYGIIVSPRPKYGCQFFLYLQLLVSIRRSTGTNTYIL